MKRLFSVLCMMVFLLNCGVAFADDDYNCIPYHSFRKTCYLYTSWAEYDSSQCEKREYYEYICDYCHEVIKGYDPLERADHIMELYEPHCEHIEGTQLHYFIYVCQRCPYDETVTLPCPGNGTCATILAVAPEYETE